MSDRTRLDYGQQVHCWEEASQSVVSFILDGGQVFGCNFFHLVSAQYLPETEQLLLQWAYGHRGNNRAESFGFLQGFCEREWGLGSRPTAKTLRRCGP
jgi:hypothetical protein